MKAPYKILVTGSNGLLGQKIIHALKIRSDIQVIATSRGENRLSDKNRYIYDSMNVEDLKNVDIIINKYKPHSVIHTAAMTQVDDCEKKTSECWSLNVVAVANLISACLKHDSHLVHLSTDFIFDGNDGPYDETAAANPLSIYGTSKLASEKLINDSSVSASIIRTMLVYGIADDMSRSNIVLWAKSALEKKQPLNIVYDQFRTPTLAEDLANGCIQAAIKRARGVYNVSGDELMSIEQMVRRVAQFFDLDDSIINPISTESLNQKAPRPLLTGFNVDKAKRELGYSPHSFEEGIKLVMSQFQNAKK